MNRHAHPYKRGETMGHNRRSVLLSIDANYEIQSSKLLTAYQSGAISTIEWNAAIAELERIHRQQRDICLCDAYEERPWYPVSATEEEVKKASEAGWVAVNEIGGISEHTLRKIRELADDVVRDHADRRAKALMRQSSSKLGVDK